jgi:hypothetical protein
MDIDNIIREHYQKGTPINSIAQIVGRHRTNVIHRARRLGLVHPGRSSSRGIIDAESSLKGETAMRDATSQEQSRIERLLEKNGYRPRWGVAWVHLQDEGIKTTTLLRNPEEVAQEERDAEEFLEKIRKAAPRYRKPKVSKVKDGHLHVIDVADLHINKLALDRNGVVTYNAEKAVAIAEKAVNSLVTRGQGYNIEQFILPIGNDVLHTEGLTSATSKGTPQTTDRHNTSAIDMAFHMYVGMIESLLTVAPVKIIHCRDNHAEFASYMLAREVAARLHHHKWLTKDISRLDRAYHEYGLNLIGFDHGHGVAGAKLPQVVAAEVAAMWGRTKHRRFIRHHVHHGDFKKSNVLVKEEGIMKDYPGLTVQYMRSPAGTDDYHHNEGYIGVPKAVDSFIFHPTMGQVAHLTCPCD